MTEPPMDAKGSEGIIARVEDWLLARLQIRCQHPGNMVTADLMEGSVDDLQLKYCRRCGAVKAIWQGRHHTAYWRRPDPNLWRG